MRGRTRPTEPERRPSERDRLRLRVARDLHDGVGTALSLIALYSAVAEQEENLAEVKRLASEIRWSAHSALAELRAVLQALPEDPITLSDLAAGLTLLGKRSAEPIGAIVEVAVEDVAGVSVAGPVRMAIVRVFQEAIHNALRHGQAHRVRASLAASEDQVELVIADDGLGFELSLHRVGSGIDGMRERARELGGELSIESLVNVGSRVRLTLPSKGRGGQ